MAAYASTVVLATPKVNKLEGPIGVLYGTCELTNYNQTTLAEITAITGCFKGACTVVPSSVGTHMLRWDYTAKAFRAFVSSTGAEVATDAAVGVFSFVAFGIAP